ncbi:MAG: type IX secretion system sortase PorU [Flavobacteriales bacterium]|nr:type IX secretion system sortase PorU [Flavobacteriales bacterium]MBP9079976.1 type IX secretion system sortase PorU [Flavobacteriales bacterium]
MRASLGILLLSASLAASAQQRSPVSKVPAGQERQADRSAPTVQQAPVPAWWGKAVFDADRQNLPLIHEVRPLSRGATGVTVHLLDQQWQALTADELRALPGLGEPGGDAVVRAAVGTTRKRPIAMVDIEPYRRNPATGRVERLMSYRLTLVEEHGAATAHRSASYPASSKLAQGDWYRFTVPTDGVYVLTYPFLQQLGVEVSGLASDAINIYGNHAGMLPFANTPFLPTDLLQNAIRVEDGGDGQFEPGDRILFYASGAQRWVPSGDGQRFEHVKNIYSDSASYFVGIGTDAPKRIGNAALGNGPATDQVTVFNDRQVIDNDGVNVVKSGRVRFSEVFDQVTSYNYGFTLPNLNPGDSTWLQVNLLGRSIGGASSFIVQAAGVTRNISVTNVGTGETAPYGNYSSTLIRVPATGSNLTVSVTYNKFDPITSLGYMDYLEVNARRTLRMAGDQLAFRDLQSVGAGRVGNFILDQAAAVEHIWEITAPTEVAEVAAPLNGSQRSFLVATDSLRQFIAFKNSGLATPTAIGPVPAQDLHATPLPTDLVIVVPEQYLGEATRLAQHRAEEGLVVQVATTQQVFNEFSSGQRDATAIKRYMKMLYDRAGTDSLLLPRYLLLFGDGSYDNLSLAPSNQNLVPTYQSANSWTLDKSYTTDDYFVMLDDAEGEAVNDAIDMGVGRLPVSNMAQARSVVEKLLNYDRLNLAQTAATACEAGGDGGAADWRNSVLFCSDDQDGNVSDGVVHMKNSDILARRVEDESPCLNVNKIYTDAYVQYSTPGGQRYPDATNEIRDRVQKGALLVNYVGHGGEVGWAHERILDNTTILGWTNFDRLPLFMTATCEFSRWDDPVRTSAGEYVLLNANGGGVGLMTTTRLAYSSSNQNISNDFFDVVFLPTDEQGRDRRLGDTYRQTKVAATPSSSLGSPNHRIFSLLGDPSARLAMARNTAVITAITDTLGNPMDTIKALSVVRITGTVNGADGLVLQDFNGTVVPTVYDKKVAVTTLENDPNTNTVPFHFDVRKNIIYRGRATVTNGQFRFTFVVPKDIDYRVDSGRVSIYAESLATNACGYTNGMLVGGTDENALADDLGPSLELYMNDERFVNGGTTSETPLLYAKLYDNSGINTMGSSIGHDLAAVLDANTQNAIVLNDWYEADKDTYKSGSVRYRLNSLAEGSHTLDLKAWDVHNNSSSKRVDFVVAPSAELALEHVLNYPNPFTTRTEFQFEHNRPCTTLDCQVQVFTVAGRLVKTINRRLNCNGFRSEPLPWDGLDDQGDRIGRGVYVYRLSISTPSGERAEKLEKLVILR